MRVLSRSEALLAGAVALLMLVALAAPPVALHTEATLFADQRAWLGIPNAADVLSNLAFAVAGAWGLWRLARLPRRAPTVRPELVEGLPHQPGVVERGMALLFFIGLLCTAAGSSWYHWAPDAAGLAIDRGGMAIAFAGAIGLACAGRVSARAGLLLALLVLVWSPFAIHASTVGNIVPWAAVQVGGMGLLVLFSLTRALPGALDIRWGLVILAYAVAKFVEVQDASLFALTDGFVAGHPLKHVIAAGAALPVIAALGRVGQFGQNARTSTKVSPAAGPVETASPARQA